MEKKLSIILIILSIVLSVNCKTGRGKFTDNNDGTVKFEGKAGTFGGNSYRSQTLTFMKCSQGQTWNSETNSCDGTAGQYQFCTTKDNNCNGGVTTNELGVGGFLGGSTSQAYFSCNDLIFAGKTDWRLPTKEELKTLIHCTDKTMPDDDGDCGDGNFTSPSVNNLFPNTVASGYWSSSTVVDVTNSAWNVYFHSGYTDVSYKTGNYYVRCVRGL